MEKECRQKRPEKVLRQPGELPDRVVRARGCDDVDRERREAKSPEDARRGSALAGHREESDGQVEQSDESEEEIREVGMDGGLPDREGADGIAGLDHDVVGKWAAGEV